MWRFVERAIATPVARLQGRRVLGRLADGTRAWTRAGEDHLVAHPGAASLLPLALAAVPAPPEPGGALSFVHTFAEPVGLLTCVPVGPGDEIVYARRRGRTAGVSRFVKGKDGVPCRTFVVWLATSRRGVTEVGTAYVGRVTPAEPWRPRARRSRATWETARAFWASHALVWDGDVEPEPPPSTDAPAYWEPPPGVVPAAGP